MKSLQNIYPDWKEDWKEGLDLNKFLDSINDNLLSGDFSENETRCNHMINLLRSFVDKKNG